MGVGSRSMIHVKATCIARQQLYQEEKILVKLLWEMYNLCWDRSLQLESSYPKVHQYL